MLWFHCLQFVIQAQWRKQDEVCVGVSGNRLILEYRDCAGDVVGRGSYRGPESAIVEIAVVCDVNLDSVVSVGKLGLFIELLREDACTLLSLSDLRGDVCSKCWEAPTMPLDLEVSLDHLVCACGVFPGGAGVAWGRACQSRCSDSRVGPVA